MGPEQLRERLVSAGLVLLGVGREPGAADVLLVYLHGNAGQWAGGGALRKVAAIPGVVEVSESDQAPTILRVRVGCPG